MCLATTVTSWSTRLDSSRAQVRPDTPALVMMGVNSVYKVYLLYYLFADVHFTYPTTTIPGMVCS